MANNYNLNSQVLSLKCAGPLQLVVTILHYNKCEEEKSIDNNRPVVCRPAPEKASGVVHNMVMRTLSKRGQLSTRGPSRPDSGD